MDRSTIKRFRTALLQSPFLWRWGRNFDRALKQTIDSQVRKGRHKFVDFLRTDGIVSGSAQDFFDEDGICCLSEVMAEVPLLMRSGAQEGARLRKSDRKNYLTSLLPREFDLDSAFVRLAIHPAILLVANQYLGLRSSLRAINLWVNRPTPERPTESQLWHRDGDDRMILKVFIYLVDVDMDNGPFWFIPGTHLRRCISPGSVAEPPRIDDQAMRMLIGDEQWKSFTGPSETIIFADTTGLHKGGKCDMRERILLTFEYVSGASPYPREFTLRSEGGLSGLNPQQVYALLS
jgi:hypothetical protein